MTTALQADFDRSARITRAAGSVLVLLMAVCIGIVFDAFAGRLSPAWRLGYLPWASGIAALVGTLSESQVHRFSLMSGERLSYRLSETVVLILLLKIGFFIFNGLEFSLAELARYPSERLSAFFSGRFTALVGLSYIAWGFTIRMAGGLIDLSVDSEILEEGARPSMTTDRYELRSRMAGGILFLGAVLIVIATLTRADMRGLWGDAPIVASGAAGVIAYFCLAMVVFSLNQFSVLRGRWGWERTPIREGIARAWVKYAAAAITIVLVVAALLPTGYSLGLFEAAGVVFRLLYALAAFVVYLLVLPLLLLLSAINREAVREFENPLEDLQPPPSMTPGEAITASDPALWLEAARSLIFWAAFLGIALYAIVQFARHNEALWGRLTAVPLFARLLAVLRAVRDWFTGAVHLVVDRAQTGLERVRLFAAEGSGARGREFFGINRLSARDRVLQLYLAFRREAGEIDPGSGPAQTPLEFADALVQNHPSAEADIRSMTTAFEKARYTRLEIGPDSAADMQTRWQRVRSALKRDR